MEQQKTFDQAFAEICSMEGTLSARLTALTGIIGRFGPEFNSAYDNLIAQLSASSAGNAALKEGDTLPGGMLTNQHGRLVDLQSLFDQGPAVISFNRGHWCEYCDLELRAFAAAHAEFAGTGASIISIMPEHQEYTQKISERCGHTFQILTDMDNSYAMQLNLVIWLGDDVRRLLSGVGVDLAKSQGNGSWFVPIPATFVTSRGGRVAARFIDPDFRKRMDIDTILAALAPLSVGA